jgi:pimeloyl-ACP methyl ester carboxylesterase
LGRIPKDKRIFLRNKEQLAIICEKENVMPDKIRVFMSPEIEAKFFAAYEAVLKQWPIPYNELYVPTRFGDTHVVASGPKEAVPLILLNPGGGSIAIWSRNIESLSRNYRAYAVDVIGEMNKSVPTRRIRNNQEFTEWIDDLFNSLKIESSHVIGNSI